MPSNRFTPEILRCEQQAAFSSSDAKVLKKRLFVWNFTHIETVYIEHWDTPFLKHWDSPLRRRAS